MKPVIQFDVVSRAAMKDIKGGGTPNSRALCPAIFCASIPSSCILYGRTCTCVIAAGQTAGICMIK